MRSPSRLSNTGPVLPVCGRPGLSRLVPLLAPVLLANALGCRDDAQSPTDPVPTISASPEFAVASNTWLTRANMPSDRFGPTVAVVTNSLGQTILYAIGGHIAGAPYCSGGLSKVQAYNAATNTWTTRAPLPIQLSHTNGAGVVNGEIYISGGCFGYKYYSNWLFMYDPATNTWTRKRDLPITGFDGTTGVIDNKLYVVTSCDGQEDCDYGSYPVPGGHPDRWLFRYDPAADTWTELGIPPRVHLRGVAATIAKQLYVVGGFYAGDNALDVYHPATNTWSQAKAMASVRYGMAGAAISAKLYAIAGFRLDSIKDTWIPVATTSVYDPTSDAWKNLAPSLRSGDGMAAGRIVVNGQVRLEMVGGSRPGNNLTYVP
jgi:N-acetylneuraminic acid mutarotase